DYNAESERQEGVENFYKTNHICQTYDFVKNMREKYGKMDKTAEAVRRDYPDEDWLHLTGLIHDLGEILFHPNFGKLPQWAVVGGTYPVGCAFEDSIVHHKYFKENPDFTNPKYNTTTLVYSEGCGLENVLMSWGHDDYMYMVLVQTLDYIFAKWECTVLDSNKRLVQLVH
ncbi:inositol oxygenase 1-like, partial [Olea europaea subsp. europaea]